MSRMPVKIPPMLADTIVCGIASLDKMLFAETGPCRLCGGRAAPYDTKEKIYATLHTAEGGKKITVFVRRFRCSDCGTLIYANEPFYPDTRLGSSVVDLAIALSLMHSFTHTAEIINAMGIEIDRGSVRKYALSDLPVPKINFFYGFPLPFSLFSFVGRPAALKNGSTAGTEILAASGFPAAYRAPPDGAGTSRTRQKQRKEQKQKEKRESQKPADQRKKD
ncbi:hypothetical protein McpSp1_15610 [Methanocorpusculaceae archaeon Sp1]|uniref:Transposase IS204/IS1001/IS1096/IS1165 zinc-finger domain-containing protein n=2 Tax=Methanorbis furvi TaxID=3028299 RepID=A0AAE4MCG1_9EURY|nr:hypothetical protein [Methanocorpusculaceae archaeon Sp1]MDV0441555.1 hypothetical protein [Methanocorpusculaceae archaeon Ag1]